eukprot:6094247-Alexandrium_andersonii.AAC.1
MKIFVVWPSTFTRATAFAACSACMCLPCEGDGSAPALSVSTPGAAEGQFRASARLVSSPLAPGGASDLGHR